MKNRADSVNFASYLAIETIEFVLFEDVVAQYFVGRNVGILNYIFRALFRATLSLVVKNVEAIEHIVHLDTVFVGEHFASVEVFVGRKRVVGKILHDGGLLDILYLGVKLGIYPPLIFLGIGCMTDFGPLISNPKSLLLGAAAQVGIFATFIGCLAMAFPAEAAASIGIIGGADGPTAIYTTSKLYPTLLGPIAVAAYSYMALIPLIQPPLMRLITTKKEREIKMEQLKPVSKRAKIIFPIVVTIIVGLVAPDATALIGFLMFGNLIRECGVLDSLSETAQKVLANLITILLGITVARNMNAEAFLRKETALILGLGLVAFIVDTAGGVVFAKILNIFLPEGKKFNPMIGAAGISAFPMSSRVVHKLGLEEDNQNFLLMHATGVNVSGQVASVIAGGMILNFFGN